MNDNDLAAEKSALRKSCYERRVAIAPKAAAAAANEIAGRAVSEIDLSAVTVTADTVISAYWPLKGELDPRPALKALATRGGTLALPRVIGDGKPLAFHRWHPDDDLIEGSFKVMEPAEDSPIVTPAILLVPLLAFDHACHRLGHGKGYYDRTLRSLRRQNPATLAIGVAFAAQEVDRVPTDAYDETLDMVITERAVHRPVSPV